MLVPLRCFSYIPHADHSEEFFRPWLCFLDRREFSLSPRAGFRQDIRFCYTIVVTTTQKQSQILCLDQTKTQEQGLTGYSSVRLTSRASHRLGNCRLSWVWLGLGLLSALSWCTACLGRGSHRHASSGFVLTWPRLYICLSFYTHRAVSIRDSLTLLELVLVTGFSFTPWAGFQRVRSFSYTPRACFNDEFLLHPSSWV